MAQAQTPRAPLNRLAADAVTLDDGTRLLGAVIGQTEQHVTLVAERKWLAETYPDYYRRLTDDENQRLKQADGQLLERIETWQAERSEDARLLAFLQDQLDQVHQRLKADVDPRSGMPLIVLELDAQSIRNVFRQPAERRRILLLAWRHEVRDASTRTSTALRRELVEGENALDTEVVDLRGLVTPPADDERQWAARQALVEYGLRKPLDFQGMGQLLIATDEETAVDQILTQLLADQLTSQIQQLLGQSSRPARRDRNWLADASKTAEQRGVRGFLVKMVEPDLMRSAAVVRFYFVARMPDESWQVVAEQTQVAATAENREPVLQDVAADPRVRQALQLLEALGLRPDQTQLQTALAFGAAVQTAHQVADAQFLAWQQSFLLQLDQPSLFQARSASE